jgi:LysR family transcriptional regulator, putative pyruvate carboxylase regulator
VFLSAAEHGSFGRAASALGMAQPSVSNRIAALERRLGGPLFSRSTRGATLTPAGERLVPHARRAMQVIDDVRTAARTTHYRAPIRVLLAVSYATVLLPAVVDALNSADRPLSVSYDHGPNVVRAIATGEADIGFLAPCPHPTSVVLRSLGVSPVVAVVAPDHPLATQGRLTVADLGNAPIAFSAWGDGAELFLEQLPADARVCTILPVFAAAQLAHDRGYVVLASRAALAAELRSRTLTQLRISDLPTASTALALASRRDGTIPIADLTARTRHALRAPSARAPH